MPRESDDFSAQQACQENVMSVKRRLAFRTNAERGRNKGLKPLFLTSTDHERKRDGGLGALLHQIPIIVATMLLIGCTHSSVSNQMPGISAPPTPPPAITSPNPPMEALNPDSTMPTNAPPEGDAAPTSELPQEQHYTAQFGDTLVQIAMLFGVSVDAIVEANDLPNPDVISAGQELVIPAPLEASDESIYIVQPGDMLIQIAMVYGVPVEEIVAANGLTDSNMITVGQALVIPTNPALENSERDCVLTSAFVADVTVADDTQLPADAPFTTIWRMRNSGSCDWEQGYELVFVRGNLMEAPSSVPVPPTQAGGTLDIAVDMAAPSEPGYYTSVWQMQAPDSTLFGIQPYVRIVVPGEAIVAADAGQIVGPAWTPTPVPSTAQASIPPTTQPTPSPTYMPPTVPIISGITSHTREIFLAGQSMGNRPNVFAKVGDSITAAPAFLYGIGEGRYVLHSYAYLEPAILFFSSEPIGEVNSFNNDSLAAMGGWTSVSILDPTNAASHHFCTYNTPLECEYERIRPSIAIIMIGTNESETNLASGLYQQNLNRMIEISIDMGVIPVLTTIPRNTYRDPRPYNSVIASTAQTHDVPLLDYWAAMEALPNRGLSEDNIHPSAPPDGNTSIFSTDGLTYGYTMRNLVTMQMLDALWRQVMY